MTDIMKIPEMAEIKLAFYNSRLKLVLDQLQWENVARLGGRSLDGQVFDLTVRVDDFLYELSFAADKDMFCIRLTPMAPTSQYKLNGCENCIQTIIGNIFRGFNLQYALYPTTQRFLKRNV